MLGVGAAVILLALVDGAPQARFVGPLDGSTVNGTVEIRGATSGTSQVAAVKVRIDADKWFNATDTSENRTWLEWTASWDSTTVSDGPHEITVSAWDSEGQGPETTVKVQVANPPWVRILSPSDKTIAAGTVTIAGEAGDPSALGKVDLIQVSIDPPLGTAVWQNATRTGPGWSQWSFTWDTASVGTDGWHVVAVRAFDGELYSKPSVNAYYLGDAPFAEILYPTLAPPETVHGIVLVNGIAGDADRVQLVGVRLDGGAWNNATDTSSAGSWSTWAYQWDSRLFSEGEHALCAQAWDGSKYSDVVCGVVYINNEWAYPPTVEIANPAEGETLQDTKLLYGYAGGTSGVRLVEVQFDSGDWERALGTGRTDVWSTWAFEWDTTTVANGNHKVCARSFDGSLYSGLACVTVRVQNDGVNDGSSSDALQAAGLPPWIAGIVAMLEYAGYLPVFVVPVVGVIIVLLRSHKFSGQ